MYASVSQGRLRLGGAQAPSSRGARTDNLRPTWFRSAGTTGTGPRSIGPMYPQTTSSHARETAFLHVGSASLPAAPSRLRADDPSQLTDRGDFSHAASCAPPPGTGSLSSVGKVCHPLLRRSSLPMTDEILTLPEVAKLLKVTDKTVYSLAQKGTLPGFKVGGQWRFKRVDIDAWIEEQKAVLRGEDDS